MHTMNSNAMIAQCYYLLFACKRQLCISTVLCSLSGDHTRMHTIAVS